ncbi:hypothetical protein Tco_0648709 [Tanacetum coccineum]
MVVYGVDVGSSDDQDLNPYAVSISEKLVYNIGMVGARARSRGTLSIGVSVGITGVSVEYSRWRVITDVGGQDIVVGSHTGYSPDLVYTTWFSITLALDTKLSHPQSGMDGTRVPDGHWTLLSISSTKHKERPLRVSDQRPPNQFRHDIYPFIGSPMGSERYSPG